MPDEIDYEKISYGKVAYKRVQRLRRKGKRRNINVPYLNYELHKPEKPRVAFWIVAAVSVVLLIGILIGSVFLYNELVKLIPDFEGIGDLFTVLFDPETFAISAGLSALSGLAIILAVLLLILLFLLPVLMAIGGYSFVREAFYMARCSKEEFAKGTAISSLIFGLSATLATLTALLIVLLMTLSSENAKLIFGLVYGGLAIMLGSLLVLLILEKRKNAKWFEGLEEDQKQNYLAHDRALRQVKRRLKSERQMWDDIGRLGR